MTPEQQDSIRVTAVLNLARYLIRSPKKWSQFTGGEFMVDRDGPRCPIVAICHAEYILGYPVYLSDSTAQLAFCEAAGAEDVVMWNKTATHKQVLAAFDRAITRQTGVV